MSKITKGLFVEAIRNLDPSGARVKAGMVGICFGDENCYGDGCGPIIRWQNGGTCNVNDASVKVLEGQLLPEDFVVKEIEDDEEILPERDHNELADDDDIDLDDD